jgi:hypothetical protein
MPVTTHHPKSLRILPLQLKQRLLTPCWSMTFYLHLVFGVIVFGGIGVFASLWKHWAIAELPVALVGYFTPLVGAALLEFDSQDQPYIRSFGLFAFFGLGVLAFFAIVIGPPWQLLLSLAGTGLGILFWWVANGLNPRFNDVIKPQNAYGGDPSAALHESADKGWAK